MTGRRKEECVLCHEEAGTSSINAEYRQGPCVSMRTGSDGLWKQSGQGTWPRLREGSGCGRVSSQTRFFCWNPWGQVLCWEHLKTTCCEEGPKKSTSPNKRTNKSAGETRTDSPCPPWSPTLPFPSPPCHGLKGAREAHHLSPWKSHAQSCQGVGSDGLSGWRQAVLPAFQWAYPIYSRSVQVSSNVGMAKGASRT